jgi:hypothetical protein
LNFEFDFELEVEFELKILTKEIKTFECSKIEINSSQFLNKTFFKIEF